MVKILHAADFHLDSPFAGLSPERARLRRQESRALPDRLVDWANDHGAELLLLSGDLFDGSEVYPETMEALVSALGRFRGEVVIAPGNHDPYTSRSPYASALWPANVHIFQTDRLEKLEFPQYGCTVWGAAFTSERSEALELPFRFAASEETVSLLVIHGDVAAPQSPYRPILLPALAQSGLDYAALGHIHACSGVRRAEGVSYAYPGCPEGRGFDELDEKGFLFGTVGKGTADLEFVPFARRKYRKISADGTENASAACREALQGCAEDIVRLTLTGEGSVDTEALERELAGLAWQLEVRSEMHAAEDLWEHCGEDTLRGVFLQRLRTQFEEAQTEEERTVIEQAVRFGIAAMEGRDL